MAAAAAATVQHLQAGRHVALAAARYARFVPFRRAVSPGRHGNGEEQPCGVCETSGDRHLGGQVHLPVACLETSSLQVLPAWPQGAHRQLALA